MNYQDFLQHKRFDDIETGLTDLPDLKSSNLFDFQLAIVNWALRRGRASIFADCGLGKTAMQLVWADHVPGRIIIAAPLAVAQQTVREALKFNIQKPIGYLREDDGATQIVVTNYEMLPKFDPSRFGGIVLDESSILKSYTGKFRTYLLENWCCVPFRLAATATPAPNDYMELGNHSEFMGAMSRTEMLSHFFVHDGGETQKWRLKGHATSKFWEWMCSWAVMLRKPSDLGFANDNFDLPPLHTNHVQVEVNRPIEGFLFELDANTLSERQDARRSSIAERVDAVAELVNGSSGPWVVWCDLNAESARLKSAIEGAVEITGSQPIDEKEEKLTGFADGDYPVLVTKPSIAGWGVNWQHCSHMAFTGLSDSYEQFYQAVRRCWRFGQAQPVHCYVVTARTEGAVLKNIERKNRDAERMAKMMVQHMSSINTQSIRGITKTRSNYEPAVKMRLPSFLR